MIFFSSSFSTISQANNPPHTFLLQATSDATWIGNRQLVLLWGSLPRIIRVIAFRPGSSFFGCPLFNNPLRYIKSTTKKKTDVHFTPTVLQPGPLPCVQTCVRPQPKLGTSAPITEGANLERGKWGKGEGILKGIKHHCGVCGHLIFAVVLFVFSPPFAVGVCIADTYSGECCNVNGKVSVFRLVYHISIAY